MAMTFFAIIHYSIMQRSELVQTIPEIYTVFIKIIYVKEILDFDWPGGAHIHQKLHNVQIKLYKLTKQA